MPGESWGLVSVPDRMPELLSLAAHLQRKVAICTEAVVGPRLGARDRSHDCTVEINQSHRTKPLTGTSRVAAARLVMTGLQIEATIRYPWNPTCTVTSSKTMAQGKVTHALLV